MLKEKYDALYSNNESVFGPPEDFVRRAMGYKNEGRALDVGCGEGRNAILLAANGFHVEALDLSSVAIQKLQEYSWQNDLPIYPQMGDICEEDVRKGYDMILLFFILHHLGRQTALDLIEKLKQSTKLTGLHVVGAITREGDFYKNNPRGFYLENGELSKIYKDWKILEHEEKEQYAFVKNKDNGQIKNICAYIIASRQE